MVESIKALKSCMIPFVADLTDRTSSLLPTGWFRDCEELKVLIAASAFGISSGENEWLNRLKHLRAV